MNYIVVPSLKLVLNMDIEDIEEYEIDSIDELFNEDNINTESVEIGDSEIGELTIREIYELYKYYKLVQSISGFNKNKILLYWLINKGIEYEIEDEIDEKEYRNKGFSIISLDEDMEVEEL